MWLKRNISSVNAAADLIFASSFSIEKYGNSNLKLAFQRDEIKLALNGQFYFTYRQR
jgi:hypothetical protein